MAITEEVELTLLGDVQSLSVAVIDSTHTNPLGCWESQGKPEYPTKAQLAELELASQPVWENIPAEAGKNVLKLKLEPESVTIVKAVLAYNLLFGEGMSVSSPVDLCK